MNRFSDVLDICLSQNNQILSSKVVILFSKLNPNLVNFDLFNNLFITKSSELLNQTIRDPTVIGRLSSILLYSALNAPKQSDSLIPLIIKLLDYVAYPGCCEIYHSLCDYNVECDEVGQSLVKNNFSNAIMYVLSKKKDEESIAQLIKIIRMSAGNKILNPTIKKPEICVQLFLFLKSDDHEIKTQLWRCLTALISEKTCLTLKQALPNALQVVGESFHSCDMYRIFAFDFIGKLLHFLPSIAEELIQKQIFEITFKCLIQFPEATHLIASVFRFIRTAYTIPEMKKWFFSIFVPFMMTTVKGKDRNSTSAYCFLLLSDLDQAAQNDIHLRNALKNVHGYPKFCEEVLLPKKQLQNSPYGGKIVRDFISPFGLIID